jgi:hypothetical protein
LPVEKTKFLANKPYWHEAVKLERRALCGKPIAATVIRFLPHIKRPDIPELKSVRLKVLSTEG